MKCRACGAPIFWEKTDKGKAMPINEKKIGPVVVLVEGGGGRIARVVTAYQPHWATCPAADSFRGGRR